MSDIKLQNNAYKTTLGSAIANIGCQMDFFV